jgi:hypothetical protein
MTAVRHFDRYDIEAAILECKAAAKAPDASIVNPALTAALPHFKRSLVALDANALKAAREQYDSAVAFINAALAEPNQAYG